LYAPWDIFPTSCDISGSGNPDDIDGISILPSITGKGKQVNHQYLYWEYPEIVKHTEVLMAREHQVP
jgi:arylsulfatase A